MGSMMAGIPASPELLARVAALPAASDKPDVDPGWARTAAPHFTLRQVLRPFAFGLIIGLILDALDALASIAMPALVRGGIDQGVEAGLFRAVALIAGVALAIVLGDWVINTVQTLVVGRNGERVLYTPPGEDLRPAAAAGAGFLRAGDVRADHDPDDVGRGRAVVVPADRPHHHGQFRAVLPRRAGRAAGHQPPAGR